MDDVAGGMVQPRDERRNMMLIMVLMMIMVMMLVIVAAAAAAVIVMMIRSVVDKVQTLIERVHEHVFVDHINHRR